jgi:hypothetical protein
MIKEYLFNKNSIYKTKNNIEIKIAGYGDYSFHIRSINKNEMTKNMFCIMMFEQFIDKKQKNFYERQKCYMKELCNPKNFDELLNYVSLYIEYIKDLGDNMYNDINYENIYLNYINSNSTEKLKDYYINYYKRITRKELFFYIFDNEKYKNMYDYEIYYYDNERIIYFCSNDLHYGIRMHYS